jgi:RNA polymerase sigma-70 factor (family 1)
MIDPLAVRIKLGDEQAFELLFRRYYVRLCGFVNKFLKDPDQAHEIVQEVFVKIWEGREDIDPENCLQSYLFKIAQNLSLNRLKRIKTESRYLEIYKYIYIEHSDFSASESLFTRELENDIAGALEKLPGGCRKIFELSRKEGLKYREIAEILQISVKTVETQMSKALRIMRAELHEYL